MKTETKLHCRKAETDDDAYNIGRLLVEMAKEVARVEMTPQDYNAAFSEIINIVKSGLAYLVADESGLVVASLGLVEANPWYAPRSSYLAEQRLYVVRGLRGGKAIKMLEDAAMRTADERAMPVHLKYFDPDKMRDEARKVSIGSESVYIPAGKIIRFNSSGVAVTEG